MIFLAKNAIKRKPKKPDCWAPSPVVLDHTEISLQAPPLHPLPSKVRSVFAASEVRTACFSLVSLGPAFFEGFGCVLPRSPGVWHPLLLQKTWPFYLLELNKSAQSFSRFFFSLSFEKQKKTRISKTHLFALEVFC